MFGEDIIDVRYDNKLVVVISVWLYPINIYYIFYSIYKSCSSFWIWFNLLVIIKHNLDHYKVTVY